MPERTTIVETYAPVDVPDVSPWRYLYTPAAHASAAALDSALRHYQPAYLRAAVSERLDD